MCTKYKRNGSKRLLQKITLKALQRGENTKEIVTFISLLLFFFFVNAFHKTTAVNLELKGRYNWFLASEGCGSLPL